MRTAVLRTVDAMRAALLESERARWKVRGHVKLVVCRAARPRR
jgi:hypothetical protein